ncbi:hypothetical protein [Neobacillus rhizophilus]|uniref:Uncharacterized protein n=1 Tax=Neobacillus rhizophilus TaxID=2833579 RepID=A0A942YZH1_9BACI|nr:hypothetical protein [Neobacillus rhizophilus]MBS4216106.1 hypothetical protein [Neobacillus rhizophilus]MBU8919900.1 hypothetical protein [Bacillus sp. FJAT-29953]
MLKVGLKVKGKSFTVPVPYVVLKLFGSVITSRRFIDFINKSIKKGGEKFVFPKIEKRDLKPLLDGLTKYKGLLLVDTKLKDGTEVTIRL